MINYYKPYRKRELVGDIRERLVAEEETDDSYDKTIEKKEEIPYVLSVSADVL